MTAIIVTHPTLCGTQLNGAQAVGGVQGFSEKQGLASGTWCLLGSTTAPARSELGAAAARQLQQPGQEDQVGLVGRLRAGFHHPLQPAQDLCAAELGLASLAGENPGNLHGGGRTAPANLHAVKPMS